jgi:Na+-driven multidrug efflux pump
LITVLSIGLVQVPVAWILNNRYGINGIWAAYPVAFLAMLAMQSAYYQLVWKHKPIRRI